MKIDQLGIGAIALSWLLMVSLPVGGQSVPRKLEEGMLYRQARALLLDKGWKPVVKDQNTSPPNRHRVVKVLMNKGYQEVVGCTSVGVDICEFAFRNRKGEILTLSTVYSPIAQDAILTSWKELD